MPLTLGPQNLPPEDPQTLVRRIAGDRARLMFGNRNGHLVDLVVSAALKQVKNRPSSMTLVVWAREAAIELAKRVLDAANQLKVLPVGKDLHLSSRQLAALDELLGDVFKLLLRLDDADHHLAMLVLEGVPLRLAGELTGITFREAKDRWLHLTAEELPALLLAEASLGESDLHVALLANPAQAEAVFGLATGTIQAVLGFPLEL